MSTELTTPAHTSVVDWSKFTADDFDKLNQTGVEKGLAETKLAQETKGLKPATLSDGRNNIRILPSWRGPGQDFWRNAGKHWFKDATGAIKAVAVCNYATHDHKCDLCEAIFNGIRSADDDMTIKLLEKAKAGKRVMVNALLLDSDAPDVPRLLELPWGVFHGRKGAGGIHDYIAGDMYPNLVNLKDGMVLTINKQGTGMDTTYTIMKVTPGKPLPVDIMKGVANLDRFVEERNPNAHKEALAFIAALTGGSVGGTRATSRAEMGDIETIDLDDDIPFDRPAAKTTAPAAGKGSTPSSDLSDLDEILSGKFS